MENKEKQKYVIGVIDASIIILFILLLVFTVPFAKGYIDQKKTESIESIANSCSEKNLLDSAECVTELTKQFYKYNWDNLDKELDFQTLKEQGGVCTSWSDYYNKIGQSLGFYTENIIIQVDDGLSHEFNVWSNKDQYCILDQTEIICIGF